MDVFMSKELKEYNKIYKELNEIYHCIALKLRISDSIFDIFYNRKNSPGHRNRTKMFRECICRSIPGRCTLL